MAPVSTDENRITYFGETDARNRRLKFGIKAKDRTRHVYVIGKTGMGKSTLLENMAVQDIQGGEGMCFIDPHGKTADLMLEYVPKERIRDVIVIAPFDLDNPISFNVLESVSADKRHLVVGGLMSTFKKIWEDAWSARMEYILTNTLLALLEAPDTTLLGVNRMLSDKAYRNEIISHVTDPSVKSFWVKEFANYTERMAAEAVPAIQNKVGQFTANPLIRNMIGQAKSSFDFRKAMDERKIIIINLSKGRIGDENMKLLGGLLVTKIYLAAMSRADVPDRVMKMLPNFYLFVDEFQNFANASFADILSEARKYKLNLTIAHQYIEQMDEIVRPAVFGNVGTMIAFRVGATDGEVFEKEFAPVFVLEDLVNLGFAQIYLKLMIDGLSSAPFSATTLPPIPHPDKSYVEEIIAASREQFSKPKAEVEVEISKFHDSTPAMKKIEALGDREKPSPKIGSASLAAMPKVKPVEASAPVIPPVPKAVAPVVQPSAPVAAVTSKLPVVVVPNISAPTATSITAAKPVVAAVKPNMPKPIAPKPAAMPKPELEGHSNLKDALATAMTKPKPVEPVKVVPVETASKPVLKSVTQSIAVPVVPKPATEASVPKPVSLSVLAPKPQTLRQDPKMQTKENVNSLKSALAAAMAKKGGVTPASADKIVQQAASPVPAPTKSAAQKPLKSTEKLKPLPKIVFTATKVPADADTEGGSGAAVGVAVKSDSISVEQKSVPNEVPEDVLKNVLKID
ncbi:MAG: type IV secretion system DNA-binding domain-containing protein [Candidatus Pacebacteria bacterium]|nr:type IV secretion system DNA-binding domain-containing protein [Candidatus Paceibacterota bacterium]